MGHVLMHHNNVNVSKNVFTQYRAAQLVMLCGDGAIRSGLEVVRDDDVIPMPSCRHIKMLQEREDISDSPTRHTVPPGVPFTRRSLSL